MSDQINIKKVRRKFGFSKDKEGLITRYLQEKQNWQSHIDHSKEFILKTAESKKKELCIVLGSGWLLDIPIIELSNLFRKVQLRDISHPSQIIHKFRKYNNIEFVDVDITGVLSQILKRNYHSEKLSDINFSNQFQYDVKPDFVISANILSQLSFFPKVHLQRLDFDGKDEIIEFAKNIERTHINNLPRNKSCLISEYRQFTYDKNDKLVFEENRLLIDLPDKRKDEWIWDFDLSGNFKTNKKVRFKVAALQV